MSKTTDAASTPLPPPPKTLALASLSLASKSTESPRRLRELLFPAHRFLNPSAAEPLRAPSALYDTLRATVVQAELMLLRVLGFNLRLVLPFEFMSRYLKRAMAEVADFGEDYESWGKEEREEYGVVGDVMETGIGRACRSKVIDACKDAQLANYFPARAVAVACLYVVLGERGIQIGGALGERGLQIGGAVDEWVQSITSGKVDSEDFEEAVAALKRLPEAR